MGLRSFLGSAFSIKGMMSYNNIKIGADFVQGMGQAVLKKSEDELRESFEEAIARQGLTLEHVQNMQRIYLRNAIIYFLIGLSLACYSIWCFINGYFNAGIIDLTLTAYIFVCCIKSHFWYFQIKQKKLGCTFKEWYNNTVL